MPCGSGFLYCRCRPGGWFRRSFSEPGRIAGRGPKGRCSPSDRMPRRRSVEPGALRDDARLGDGWGECKGIGLSRFGLSHMIARNAIAYLAFMRKKDTRHKFNLARTSGAVGALGERWRK